jgi:hypothetical protein
MSVDYATRCTNADVTATYIEQSGGKHTYSQRIHTGEAQWTIGFRHNRCSRSEICGEVSEDFR